MFGFLFKKKKIDESQSREESPEVVAAREYLCKTHPTLTGRDSPIATLCGNEPFEYLGCSKKGKYTRYYFCEGADTRIVYSVLCDEEREEIIRIFNDQINEIFEKNDGGFVYQDSLKGMFIGDVKHRFYSSILEKVAFMSDDGNIQIPDILEGVDM